MFCKECITELSLGGAAVWLLELREIPEEHFAQMYACCDEERQKKTDAIKNEKKRRQSIGAGYLLYLLKQKFSVESEVMILPEGKPVFREKENLWFSLSHSGEWVGLAYGEYPVGLDIESVRGVKEGVAKRFFTADEYEQIRKKEGTEKNSLFFQIWTRKEAVLKAAGTGLTISPERFSVFSDRAELLGKSYLLSGKLLEKEESIWISVAEEAGR